MPWRLAQAKVPCNKAVATPWPRWACGTTKQTIDHTGASSSGFMTGERASLAYCARGATDTQPMGVVPR